VKGQPVLRLIRHAVVLLWLAVRFLLALANAKEIAFADPNADVKQAWSLLHDDTQPIPIIR